MFAVIYRGYIKAGRDEDYQKSWHKIANYFIKHRGALGSCLHKTEEGIWFAYSRWPDKVTRDASWPENDELRDELPNDIRQAIFTIKDCIDQEQKFPEICMEVVDDLLLRK